MLITAPAHRAGMQRQGLVCDENGLVEARGHLSVEALAKWCRRRAGPAFGAEEAEDEAELADLVRLEC